MGKKVLLTILFFVLCLLGIYMFSVYPLLSSEEKIRNKLLRITPIGTHMEDVITLIRSKKKWKIDWISYEHGFNKRGDPSIEEVFGEKAIRAFIGDYRFLFTTSVTVFWGFDENSKLIDIYVWKTIDAM